MAEQVSRTRMSIARKLLENLEAAAQLISQFAPDGTSLQDASQDPNKAQWYSKAIGYLTASAKAGDFTAVETMSMHLSGSKSSPYESLVFRVAQFESVKQMRPSGAQVVLSVPGRGVVSEIDMEVQNSYGMTLTPEQIAKAKEEGVAIAKLVKQNRGK